MLASPKVPAENGGESLGQILGRGIPSCIPPSLILRSDSLVAHERKVSPRALRSLPSQKVPRKMPADSLVVFPEGIVAETPQGLTVILGRARTGDERAGRSSSP